MSGTQRRDFDIVSNRGKEAAENMHGEVRCASLGGCSSLLSQPVAIGPRIPKINLRRMGLFC